MTFMHLLILHLYQDHVDLVQRDIYRPEYSLFNEWLLEHGVPFLYAHPIRSRRTLGMLIKDLLAAGYLTPQPYHRTLTPEGQAFYDAHARGHWSQWPIEIGEDHANYAPRWCRGV